MQDFYIVYYVFNRKELLCEEYMGIVLVPRKRVSLVAEGFYYTWKAGMGESGSSILGTV